MAPHTPELSVVIAVLTYRRPGEIRALLPLLSRQATEASGPCAVLVVDNDPDAGARHTVEELSLPNVRYVHETVPGISAARNRALSEAAGYDLLAFIDDDERPVDDWLALLLATFAVADAAAVVGPVISTFDTEPEQFVLDGRFFERRRLPTGTPVQLAATNNLLLDLRRVRALGLSFDLRFGLSGGSDTLFAMALDRAGERMVWCDEAIVYDVVPPARATRTWVMQRAYRMGNSWARSALAMERYAHGRVYVRTGLLARGAARVVAGLFRAFAGKISARPADHARGLRTLARGRGLIAGCFGRVHVEYVRDAPALARHPSLPTQA
jgi:succinoglycan biosynthesis protein ExoM